MKRFKTADEFYEADSTWKEELSLLREILLETELEETIKWGMPVYTVGGKNVVGIGSFKSYFGLWFYQGIFLSDPEGVLINAQEGKTKALRQWRMISADEIRKKTIATYVREAIQNQKDGKEVKPEPKRVGTPEILKNALAEDPVASKAFSAFTPGKQKEFFAYIHEAKREATKISRVEKIIPMIREGVGLNDKYKR